MSLGLVCDSYNNDSELSDAEDSKGAEDASKSLSGKGETSERVDKSDGTNEQSQAVDINNPAKEYDQDDKDRRERNKDRDERRDREDRGKRDDRKERDSDKDDRRDGDRRDKHRDRRDDKRLDDRKYRNDNDRSRDDNYKHRRDSRDGGRHDNNRDDGRHDNNRDGGRHDNSRDGGRHDNSRDAGRHDNSRDGGRHDNRHGDRGERRRGGGRRGHNDRHSRDYSQKDREYMEYRRKKFGDNLEWGKASAEALKDVKTDSTLPSSFDTNIAKQLAAQREKRKLLWGGGKKAGEGSTPQKSVWGSGSIKNDETGEQTAKFLKLMGVKDVTAENVKNFQTDESVLRSSQVVDSFEEEYEKSRYLQHVQRGVGLGLVQFAKQPPPT